MSNLPKVANNYFLHDIDAFKLKDFKKLCIIFGYFKVKNTLDTNKIIDGRHRGERAFSA
jgi:hypothetical protein